MNVPDHEIAVIGAGIGGLGVAMALRRAGLTDFTIIERAAGIGGVWYSHRYPGLVTDVPSMSYQFSFEKNPNWSKIFPRGVEVMEYLHHCADKYDLVSRIRLNAEVTSRTWDEVNNWWRLGLRDGSTLTTRYVVSALGPFGVARRPSIPGLDEFAGAVVHTAEWDVECDLAGRRVAVVGTGAAAVQLIPEIAPAAARLHVFQRHAAWVFPKPTHTVPIWWRTALVRVPGMLALLYTVVSRALGLIVFALLGNGARTPSPTTVAAVLARAYLRVQVRDRELRRKLTPDYRFGCRRPTVSNRYYRTFRAANVELVTAGIERISATGIRTADGRAREIDVLVLATGFEFAAGADAFRDQRVTGPAGMDVVDYCRRDDPVWYEGLCLPQLPNTFSICGPHSWCGGSWHEMVEAQSRVLVRVLTEAKHRGAELVSVSPAAAARFARFIRSRSTGALLESGLCTTTDLDERRGESTMLRPTTAAHARRAARTFPLDDFDFTTTRSVTK